MEELYIHPFIFKIYLNFPYVSYFTFTSVQVVINMDERLIMILLNNVKCLKYLQFFIIRFL